MTCPTCREEAYPDTCGAANKGDTCECCGMKLIAVAENDDNSNEYRADTGTTEENDS